MLGFVFFIILVLSGWYIAWWADHNPAKVKNYKLVQFNDGRWGVRKGWTFYQFRDMKEYNYWWTEMYCMKYCATSEELAREEFERLSRTLFESDKYTIVK